MKKILFVSDSPVLNTGFGKVLRHIVDYVLENVECEAKVLGWFDNFAEGSSPPCDIVYTDTSDINDMYGAVTFPKVVEEFKPDVVFAIGDVWMVDHIIVYPKKQYHLILYSPLDGGPVPPSWLQLYSKVDTFVAYGEWAKNTLTECGATFPIEAIPHGVELERYKPMAKTESEVRPFDEDCFVVGCVARNQPRKMLSRLFKMFFVFLKPWTLCKDCGMHFLEDVGKCLQCGSKNVIIAPAKDDAKLYLHSALEDCGWDLICLAERYDLRGKISFPRDLTVGQGVPEEMMADVYNMMDVFTLPTGGEGFGLPILEAMACGVPTVVTNYSGHVDFCKGVSELINVSEFVTDPNCGIERAIVDVKDYYMRMERFYYEPDMFLPKWGPYVKARFKLREDDEILCGKKYRELTKKASIEKAQEYDWAKILPLWGELLTECLSGKSKGFNIEEV